MSSSPHDSYAWYPTQDDSQHVFPQYFPQPQSQPESIPLDEFNAHESYYATEMHAVHNNYIPASSHWQSEGSLAADSQMMHYNFTPQEVPMLDIPCSEQENQAHIPITPQLWYRNDTGGLDNSRRRSSLQPPLSTPHGQTRSRSPSLISLEVSSPADTPQGGMISRTASPGAPELEQYGRATGDDSWTCSYPGCNSSTSFRRACDLRKHYRRHFKRFHCSYFGCAHSERGFSSKKDRDRHEASHNPSVPCSHPRCNRIFSRRDNMVSESSNGATTTS